MVSRRPSSNETVGAHPSTSAARWFDEHWIDNANVHLYTWVSRIGKSGALVQNGQTQTYAVGMVIGAIVIVAGFLLWGGKST